MLEGTCLARFQTVKKEKEGQREDDKTSELSSLAQSLAEALQGGTGDRPHLAEHLAVKQPDTTSTEQTEQDLARGISCGQSAIPQATAPEFDHISLSIARGVEQTSFFMVDVDCIRTRSWYGVRASPCWQHTQRS